MKKSVLLAAVVLAATTSCSHLQTSAPKTFVGEKTTVHAIDENYEYPLDEHVQGEDMWVETLSDAPDYLALPAHFLQRGEMDSLVQLYNVLTAANALETDMFLLTRQYLTPEDMPQFDDSQVANTPMATALLKLAQAIRQPYEADQEETFWSNYEATASHFSDKLQAIYFDMFEEKMDSLALETAYDENQYVADFDSLSTRVWSREMGPQEVLDLCLKEKYFIPQTVLARQYALACYATDDSIHTNQKATGLLQSLLEADIYSPILPELWRMWRCRVQISALSISNDGEIQNHFYNQLRNRVAITILKEYASHHRPDALDAFLRLASAFNIERSGSMVGNYAFVDEMNLYWSHVNK